MPALIWLRHAVADSASDRRAWLAAFLACLPVYLLTAHYTIVSVDTQSALLPAWQLIHHGNLWVEHLHHRPFWSVPAGHHLVSNRAPGLQIVNLPFVALLYGLGPSMVPAALTAATLTAATVGFMFLVFRRLVRLDAALVATGVLAFGTSLWTIAAAEVWPHTVDAFCLAVTAYALSRGRWWIAGCALGAGVTARPHLSVVALVIGLGLGWARRSWRPVFGVGIPATVGLCFVETWNAVVYGSASVSGGYGGYAHANLTQTSGGTIRFLLTNVLGFFISPKCGLFIFLPLVILLLFGMRSAWRVADDWVRVLAVSGFAYTLLQLKINRFDGGDGFFGPRLATELVLCMAPIAVISLTSWVNIDSGRARAARALAALSVSIQAVGAFAFSVAGASVGKIWASSPIVDAFRARPLSTIAILWFGLVAAVWVAQSKPPGLDAISRRLGRERPASAVGSA